MIERYERFEYAEKLANLFPSVDDDGEGNFHETPHETFLTFSSFSDSKIEKMGLSEDAFYSQRSIIPVLEAYGLDKEKFWYAVAYINHVTRIWIDQKGLDPLPTPVKQLKEMRDGIKDQHEFKIIIDDGQRSHSIVVAGNWLIGYLSDTLGNLINRLQQTDWAYSQEIPLWRQGKYKTTEATWYAAHLFKKLFDCLKLPILRSKNKKKEFRTIEGYDVLVKGADAEITLDKNQLIAELIRFLGLTDNEDLEGNSINGILKKKRKFEFGII